jgi:hypothetical protein
MRKNIIVLLLYIFIMLLVGCSTNQIISNVDKIVPGYTYDEATKRYTNKEGIWYIVDDDSNVIIPPEEFVSRKDINYIYRRVSSIDVIDRANEVWELVGIDEYAVKEDDAFLRIVSPHSPENKERHLRMDYNWYVDQVIKLNNLEGKTNLIKVGQIIKMPIYMDKEDPRFKYTKAN